MSARFSYANSKKIDGIPGGGTTLWWGSRVAKLYGIAPGWAHPDDSSLPEGEYTSGPITTKSYDIAKQFRLGAYQRLYTTEDAMSAMIKVKGIQFGFDIFESIYTAPNGDVPLPRIGEPHVGSHAVGVIGYEYEKRLFHFVNSWGDKWGNKGHGTLSYDYFDEGLIHEVWGTYLGIGHKPVRKSWEAYMPDRKKVLITQSRYDSLRHSNSPLMSYDLYTHGGREIVAFLHLSPISEEEIEIEELFVDPAKQGRGYGTLLLREVEKRAIANGISKVVGWIGAQDLVMGREEGVLAFFKGMGYTITEDSNTRFRDAVYKFQKDLSS